MHDAARIQRARDLTPACRIPHAVRGAWSVQPRVVTADESAAMQNSGGIEFTAPGTYTWLSHKDYPNVMSDIDSELLPHLPFIERARGRVLISGLGLALLPTALLAYGQVEHIDIIELHPEVADLVWPHVVDPRMTLHMGDAHTWDSTGREWDFAWHDILYFDIEPRDSLRILSQRHKAGEHHMWQAEALGA